MYAVFEDLTDENSISVIEIWERKDDHTASLQDESVRSLISEAMPILDAASPGLELQYLGGYGLDMQN